MTLQSGSEVRPEVAFHDRLVDGWEAKYAKRNFRVRMGVLRRS